MKTTTGWEENGNGTNNCGFTGLPGGIRYSDGYFMYAGKYSMWWSSTPSSYYSDAQHYWGVSLDFKYSSVQIESFYGMSDGMYVRCIKDKE